MIKRFHQKLSKRTQQWLWFIGLYILSITALGSFCFLLKMLIPH